MATPTTSTGGAGVAGSSDALALYGLGMVFANGWGVDKDDAKALEYFAQAAAMGLTRAQYSLAVMYEHGRGCPPDGKLALQWYQAAALDNHPKAMYNLGLMYLEGREVQPSESKAAELFQQSAELGFAEAQVALAELFESGSGVDLDPAAAVSWYQKAADQGSADGQYCLGLMYVNGHGVEKDEAKAVELFLAAAQQGNGEAAFNVGIMFKKGLGVEINLLEAEHWLQVAHEHGNDDAAFELIGVRARLQEVLSQVGGIPRTTSRTIEPARHAVVVAPGVVEPHAAAADSTLPELRSGRSTHTTVSGSSSKSSSSSEDDDDRVRVVPASTHKGTPGSSKKRRRRRRSSAKPQFIKEAENFSTSPFVQKPLPSLIMSGSFGDIGDSSSPSSPVPSRKAVLNDRVSLVPPWQMPSSEPASPTPQHRTVTPTVTPPRAASSLRVSSSGLSTATASPMRSRALASPMVSRSLAADNSRELASDLVASMSHQVESLTQQLNATQGQVSTLMKAGNEGILSWRPWIIEKSALLEYRREQGEALGTALWERVPVFVDLLDGSSTTPSREHLARLCSCRHPNLAPVWGVTAANVTTPEAIVVARAQGETLASRVQRKRLSIAEASRVVEAIATGLSYARRRGIVVDHAGISSSGVYLASCGTIDSSAAVSLAFYYRPRFKKLGLITSETGSNEFLYYAPEVFLPDDDEEQHQQQRLLSGGSDDHADVYALGVLLLEMLSGSSPDPLTRDGVLASLAESLPIDIAEFVEECLSFDIGDRPALEYVGTFLLERSAS